MAFSGNLYSGDKLIAPDVLGFYSGHGGNIVGSMVLPVGIALSGQAYTLLLDSGLAISICVTQSSGEAHQAKVVQFASSRVLQEAARAALAQLETTEPAARGA